MKVIKPGFRIIDRLEGAKIVKKIEQYGRVCLKSKGLIADDSPEKFVSAIIKNGRESLLEHIGLTVMFTCDRGIGSKIMKYSYASYFKESTRYCNYSNEGFDSEITVIQPFFLSKKSEQYAIWEDACLTAEEAYFNMLAWGNLPQEASLVLPNSLKTEILMTANLSEWRYFFILHATETAHPQMRQITIPLLLKLKELIPVVFEDISYDVDFSEEHYALVSD